MRSRFFQYLGKRLARIYPIYWLYTLAVLLLFAVLYRQFYSLSHILRSLTLFPFHTELGEFPVIPPAHTLTYEIIFYIIFGLGIIVGRRMFAGLMLLWLALILLNMFWANGLFNGVFGAVIFNPINFEFFYGCCIAWLLVSKPLMLSRRQAIVLFWTAVILLLIAWISQLNNFGVLLQQQYLKFGIPFSLIIYSVSVFEQSKKQSFLKKLFVKLGDASYSIYLLHYTGIHVLNNTIFAKMPWLSSSHRLLLCLILITIGSLILYKWVEEPLINFFNRKLLLRSTK